MSVGFRVFTQRELPDRELVEQFRGLPTANVCDCMERLGVMNASIRLLSRPVEKSQRPAVWLPFVNMHSGHFFIKGSYFRHIFKV